jgi:hypothetical protein
MRSLDPYLFRRSGPNLSTYPLSARVWEIILSNSRFSDRLCSNGDFHNPLSHMQAMSPLGILRRYDDKTRGT